MTRFRSLWTRVAGIDPGLADAGLALALTIAMAGVVIGAVEPVAAVALLVMTASLAWRRRWPLGVLIVVFACMVIAGHSDGGIVEVIAVVVATYSAAIYAHNRSVADLVVLAMAAVASALGAVLPVPDWTARLRPARLGLGRRHRAAPACRARGCDGRPRKPPGAPA